MDCLGVHALATQPGEPVVRHLTQLSGGGREPSRHSVVPGWWVAGRQDEGKAGRNSAAFWRLWAGRGGPAHQSPAHLQRAGAGSQILTSPVFRSASGLCSPRPSAPLLSRWRTTVYLGEKAAAALPMSSSELEDVRSPRTPLVLRRGCHCSSRIPHGSAL